MLLAERASLPGLVGVVADVIEVPQQHLDALEASLGEAAAFVLVEDRAAIDPSIERLRSPEGGRATLLDLSAMQARTLPDVPAVEGVIGRASDLVRFDERFRPVAERLLGSVIVVDTRERLFGRARRLLADERREFIGGERIQHRHETGGSLGVAVGRRMVDAGGVSDERRGHGVLLQ